MKSFKVAQLDTMLAVKGKAGRGTKADKALDVSWCYTPEEIKEYKKPESPGGSAGDHARRTRAGANVHHNFLCAPVLGQFWGRV